MTLVKKNTIIFLLSCISFFLHAQKKSPNIILILADDLGYGDIGCYGQKKIETPNIDRLARQGVRLTQFYAGSTVCAPSRCSFMTGQHTGHTAIRGNVTIKPEGQMPLPDSTVTIAMILKQHGYITAAFGKWGLGFITTTGDPQKKGFDEFYGYNCQTLAHNYYPDHLWRNHERVDLAGNLQYDSVYSADLIHEQAINFLKKDHGKPFFLYLPYTLPHADVIAPHDSVYDQYVRKFNEQSAALPKNNDGEKHHFDPHPHAAFAAMVSRLDKYVGEILQTIREKGIEENTFIFFTSDNGPHRENGGDPDFFNSNGGLRGIKRDLYEGGIRVPFIAYHPRMVRGGTVKATPFALYDLYPTLLEIAGISLSNHIDGISILPTLTGGKQKQHDWFYWELQEAGGKQAVRMGEWKAVRLSVSKDANSPIEIYNLKADPREKKNVAPQNSAVVRKIEKIIREAHWTNNDWPLFEFEKTSKKF